MAGDAGPVPVADVRARDWLDPRDLAAKSRPPQPFGLVRDRLLDGVRAPVVLVLAPAGHGKTTLAAQVAARCRAPVAWYRVDAADRDPAVLAAGLARVVATATGLDGRPGGPPDGAPDGPPDLGALAALLAARASSAVEPPLLVVDDVHEVAGSPSERDLARFVGQAPPGLRILLAARRVPGVDVETLKISRAIEVVESDDLRFRSWEVERLFRDVYAEPLPPEDAAVLSRRTEGWAAGLAMFHLVTAGQPPRRRREALDELGRGSRLVRGYLAREVLGELTPQLRTFLTRTSSLGVLTGALCDELLGTTGSAQVLELLERRRLFIHVDRSGERYRYHQVLADHLELELTETLGAQGSREWYRRSADVLLAAGEVRAAFRALARAEDWPAVERLLRERGAQVVSAADPADHGRLPAELDRHDPWLRLAHARRLRGRGAVAEAVEAYRTAADIAEDPDLVAVCRAEARAVGVWLPRSEPQRDAYGLLRSATVRQPERRLADLGPRSDAEGVLAAGVVAALCGDDVRAEQLLGAACLHPQAGDDVVLLATCARAGLRLVTGTREVADQDLEAIVAGAELTSPWLARVARALLAVVRGETVTLPLLRISADADGDRWGVGLVTLVQALATGHAQDYREAAEALRAVGAPVVELWARSLGAAAADPGREALAELARDARGLGAREIPALAAGWRGRRLGDRAATQPTAAPAGRVAAGRAAPETAGPDPAGLRVRLLGGFGLACHGVPVDLAGVRPRARATMHLLALHAGHWVHRDVLAAAMWPEATADAALRSLQVAVSALRTALADACGGPAALPARQGESYGLVVPGGVDSDVLVFEAALGDARAARSRGDRDGERAALSRALETYAGDLLPEDGPAEWVVAERDRLRLAAADAALGLAALHAAEGDLDAAVDDVRRSLHRDPYRDAAWQLLVRLHDRAGDAVAARAAREQRARVLTELGITPGPV